MCFSFGSNHPNASLILERVKRPAEIAIGVMTQCVLYDTAIKRQTPQTFQNIVLKINAKMGGINNRLVSEGM